MKPHRAWLLALALATLAGCAKPVPPEKLSYVGDWRASNMDLSIDAGGTVRYQRRTGSASTSIEGPLQRFEGDNFLVGIGPMSTTFVVSTPPHERNGAWSMTVDGIELRKSSGDLNVERW
jgi:hypothetical protein